MRAWLRSFGAPEAAATLMVGLLVAFMIASLFLKQ